MIMMNYVKADSEDDEALEMCKLQLKSQNMVKSQKTQRTHHRLEKLARNGVKFN